MWNSICHFISRLHRLMWSLCCSSWLLIHLPLNISIRILGHIQTVS